MSLFIWPLFESESDPIGNWSQFWSQLLQICSDWWQDPLWPLVTFHACLTSSLHVFCSYSHQVIANLSQELVSGNLTSAYQVLEVESLLLVDWLGFTDFQLKLIREFSLILLGNLIFVFLAWRVYGPRINAKFFTESRGSKSEEVLGEWKDSVSQLKLPKEHDFKYK